MDQKPQKVKNYRFVFYLMLALIILSVMIKFAETEYIWYISRISALLALTSAFFVSALPLLSPISPKLTKISKKYHIKMSFVLLFVSIIHVSSILFDKFKWMMIQDIKQVIFISKDNYLATATSIGVLCLYLLITASISGIFSKKICKQYGKYVWLCTHKVGESLYILAYIHAVWIGSDFKNVLILLFFSILFIINVILIIVDAMHQITLPIFRINKRTNITHAGSKSRKSKNKNVKKINLLILFSMLLPLIISGIIISGDENNLVNSIHDKYSYLNIFNGNEQVSDVQPSRTDITFTESEIEILKELNINENDAVLAGQNALDRCILKKPREFNTHPFYRYLLDCDGTIMGIFYKDSPSLKLENLIIGGVELNWINEKIPYYTLYLKETDPLVGEINILATNGYLLSLDVEYALKNKI